MKGVTDADAKEVAIEAEALKLIVRHGFRKVRMGEIAGACRIARPTLYAVFPNKEAILTSIIRRHTRDKLALTQRKLKDLTGVGERLAYIFDEWIIKPYASVSDAEHAADLASSAPEFAPEAAAELWETIQHQVADTLRAGATQRGRRAVPELAYVLVTAVKGAKAATSSMAEYRRVVNGLVAMALAHLEKLNA